MRTILLTGFSFMFIGCGDISGDTVGDTTYDYTNEYTYTENNIDYGTGTVLQCSDANCSVMKDESGKTITSGDSSDDTGDAVVGVYSEDYTQAECNAAGFFYCELQDKCLPQRVDDASSGCGK